jgi:hypothetical protein
MHKFAQTLIGEYMGLHHLPIRMIVLGPYLLNSDATRSQVVSMILVALVHPREQRID